MVLPAPNLDDRAFQDLVDDAKRLVQQRCKEWTDHNVSDPGVTLIEVFAWMTDQLFYRLNRVPDRNYIKFLELIGVRLFPPTAARGPVTFWLSAPQPETVIIPTDTEVATVRTGTEQAIVFSTLKDLPIISSSVAKVASRIDKDVRDHTDALAIRSGFFCFDAKPNPGDVLLIGLTEPVPSNAVTLRFECRIEGVGVDPLHPPLQWEAWTGDAWEACEVDQDTTGGLNRDGDVVLHVPEGHVASVIDRVRGGWLQARVIDPDPNKPPYTASPEILALSGYTIGGTVDSTHTGLVRNDILGVSEGVPGMQFELSRRPVVSSEQQLIVEVSEGAGWQEWEVRPNFAASGPDDRHVVVDAVVGRVEFGPAVRLPNGDLRHYGAVPPKGAIIRVPTYRVGGGAGGNVARKVLRVMKSSIPYVARVENRAPATGGVDGEDLEAAKVRGPILLRTRDRAVTAEDFEHISREAAPEVARARAVPSGDDGDEAGVVRVLLIPRTSERNGRVEFGELIPTRETLEKITRRLDESRLIGTRIQVRPPLYRGLTIAARLRPKARTDPNGLKEAALTALYTYFHPTMGGTDGGGWPFGRPVLAGEVFSVLQRVRGTELVEDVRIFGADPTTGQRSKQIERLDLDRLEMVFSYEHQVFVVGETPYES